MTQREAAAGADLTLPALRELYLETGGNQDAVAGCEGNRLFDGCSEIEASAAFGGEVGKGEIGGEAPYENLHPGLGWPPWLGMLAAPGKVLPISALFRGNTAPDSVCT